MSWHRRLVTTPTVALMDQAPGGVEVEREMTIRLDARNRTEPDLLLTTAPRRAAPAEAAVRFGSAPPRRGKPKGAGRRASGPFALHGGDSRRLRHACGYTLNRNSTARL